MSLFERDLSKYFGIRESERFNRWERESTDYIHFFWLLRELYAFGGDFERSPEPSPFNHYTGIFA